MTIVVAGYEGDPDMSTHRLKRYFNEEQVWTDDDEALAKAEERSSHFDAAANPNRAYVYADSRLSRGRPGGREVVADSADKLAKADIVLSAPFFHPHGRATEQSIEVQRISCGVGYAGDTQMYHLVLDKFRELARSVRYTWLSGSSAGYGICLLGSEDDLAHSSHDGIEYDESIDFRFNDLPLLDAQFVANMMDRCLGAVLEDYVIKEASNRQSDDPNPVEFDLVLLAYCHVTRKPIIYRFGYEPDNSKFPTSFKTVCNVVAQDDMAVLGQSSWTPNLKQARINAISEMGSVKSRVRAEMKRLIDESSEQNYVGGSVLCGILDERGFNLQT